MFSIQKKLNQLTSRTSRRRYSLVKDLEDRQTLARGDLDKFQLGKLNLILTHASQTVPYFNKLFSDLGLIKNSVVSKDEKESDLRMILNFGHTFAHGFESAKNFSKKLNHGEAVLLGMIMASDLSSKKKILSTVSIILFSKHDNYPLTY